MDAHGDAATFGPTGRTDWPGLAWSAGVSLFLVAHAVAHLVGTSRAFQAAGDGESLDYLGGAWRIADPSVLRLVGFAWAVVAAAYVAAAIGEWLGMRAWWQFVAVVTVFSLVLSVLGLWEAWVGVVIDLAILMAIASWVRRPARA